MRLQRPLVVDTFAPLLYLAMLVTSILVLLRGHNEPGGGFIAGLIAVTASILWAVAHGSEAAVRRLPLRSPVRLACVGVLLAGGSGLPAWWRAEPFLTHLWGTLRLGPAAWKVSTVLLFDLGVYLCVWGAIGGYALALLGLDSRARSGAETPE